MLDAVFEVTAAQTTAILKFVFRALTAFKRVCLFPIGISQTWVRWLRTLQFWLGLDRAWLLLDGHGRHSNLAAHLVWVRWEKRLQKQMTALRPLSSFLPAVVDLTLFQQLQMPFPLVVLATIGLLFLEVAVLASRKLLLLLCFLALSFALWKLFKVSYYREVGIKYRLWNVVRIIAAPTYF